RAALANRATVVPRLYTAVRNRALNVARDQAGHARAATLLAAEGISPTLGEPPLPPGVNDAERERDERLRRVLAAANAVPERGREAFYLRWRQGLSYAEIAAVMGISVKTVETALVAAMRELREVILEDE